MRMIHMRLTIRRWMLAVMAVALLLASVRWAQRMRQRRAWFLTRAAEQAMLVRDQLKSIDMVVRSVDEQLRKATLAVEEGPRQGPLAEYLASHAADMRTRLEGTRGVVVPQWRR